jgi:hypothetical protein
MTAAEWALTIFFWTGCGLLGLIGLAMIVAGFEMARPSPAPAPPVAPSVSTVDLNLEEAGSDTAPGTDSDTRRRALSEALGKMAAPTAHDPRLWEETQPRVNIPQGLPKIDRTTSA